jgi:hypothetical protein
MQRRAEEVPVTQYVALAQRGAAGGPGPEAVTRCGTRWRAKKKQRPARAVLGWGARRQAAFSHIAVSKALLIIGMFMPKLGLVPFFGTVALGAGLAATAWATSVARSHDPISRERATEKNRNT